MKTVLRFAIMLTITAALCLCFGTAAYAGDVAINATNFPDAVFREYVTRYDNMDTNGLLSDAERADVGFMFISNKGISSLQGIEFFTELSNLYCEGNQLTSLDLSRNTALTSLYCSSNRLTALDLSQNTALTSLYCHKNCLTALNVSQSTALKYLNCGYNQLASLDVSNNTALIELSSRENQLTGLDVSNNTALTRLDCDFNQLTGLDVSRNTALTSLSCDGNQLTGLNVSRNTALTSLWCGGNQLAGLDVSNNLLLTCLDCGLNQLTGLSVSHLTALNSLGCASNQLTGLDVSHNTALTSLSCDDNQLTSLDISHNTALTYLECWGNQLTNLDISHCPELVWLVENAEPETRDSYIKYAIATDTLYYELSYDSDVTLITAGSSPVPDFVLPASLTAIEVEAFSGDAFTYVLIPAGVETIGSSVFANCPNLQYVEFAGSDTLISDNAFGGRTDFTIIAPAGSTAATWAIQHNVNFQPAA